MAVMDRVVGVCALAGIALSHAALELTENETADPVLPSVTSLAAGAGPPAWAPNWSAVGLAVSCAAGGGGAAPGRKAVIKPEDSSPSKPRIWMAAVEVTRKLADVGDAPKSSWAVRKNCEPEGRLTLDLPRDAPPVETSSSWTSAEVEFVFLNARPMNPLPGVWGRVSAAAVDAPLGYKGCAALRRGRKLLPTAVARR